MQNSVAKKIFAVGVAVSTVLLGLAPLAAQAAAHAEGTNIAKGGEVGMIIGGQYRPYTSAGAFLTYGFNSWAGVVTANADDLALPTGAFIAPQDGKIFCSTETKGTDVKGECALITGGKKAAFTSAGVFTGLGFSFARAQSGDSSFMQKTADVNNTSMAHLPGVLVNNNGTVQLVGTTGLLGIPDPATFNSWGWSFADVVTANAADKLMSQTGVMAMRVAGQLSPTALAPSCTTNCNVVTGSVTASLASDNPAGATIAINNATGAASGSSTVATLAKFVFTGTGTVTQVQVKRTGISADTIINNAYLFDGGTRLTDAASVGGSSTITFNSPTGLFTVSGSRTISVVVEIAGLTSSGQTIALTLTSFTVANGTAQTVSISGNLFTTSLVTDLATAQFGTVTPSAGSYDPAVDVQVFSSNVTISTRDMTLSRFIIRNIGTIQQADVNNFRLRVDGTQIAQTQTMDANGYIAFSFNPVTLKSGTRVVSVLADVIGGSSRNFQFQIRNKADVNFTDTQYATSLSPSNTFPVGSVTSNSINSGSLTIQKTATSPSGNVTDGTSDVNLADYTVSAYGEAMKIETLTVGATSSDASVGSLRNGRVLINGVQYGSTATLSSTTNATYSTGGTSFTLNYTVQPGSPVTLSVHADMFDNNGTNSLVNNDTVTAYIMTGSSNVQRLVSLSYGSYPASSIAGNTITDVTGSIAVSKNATYAAQTTPLPQTRYKLGSYNLVGSSSEDVTINTFDVAFNSSTTAATTFTDVEARIAGNLFATIKSSVAASSSTGTISATSTFTGSYLLQKNATVPVEIYGTISLPTVAYSSDSYTSRIALSGITALSSATVSTSIAGQQISVGTATVTASTDTANNPVAAIVAGNQTKTAFAFKWVTTNDTFTISEVVLSIPNNTTVSNVILKAKDGSAIDSAGHTSLTLPGNASSTFSNLHIVIPPNSTKIMLVDLQLGGVGSGAGTSAENVRVNLATYKSAPSATGAISTTTSGTGVIGNNTYVYKAIPTITNLTLANGTLTAGAGKTLYAFSISSGSGTISWTHLVFSYASSSDLTLASPTLWKAGNTQIVASSSVNVDTAQIVFDTTNEEQITGAENYELRATIGGTITANNDYISTNILAATTTFASLATASVATSSGITTNEFVWSDQSAQSHDLTTSDWINGYLVKNLPTDSESLTN